MGEFCKPKLSAALGAASNIKRKGEKSPEGVFEMNFTESRTSNGESLLEDGLEQVKCHAESDMKDWKF